MGAHDALLHNVVGTLSRYKSVAAESIVCEQSQHNGRVGAVAEAVREAVVLGMCAGSCLPEQLLLRAAVVAAHILP